MALGGGFTKRCHWVGLSSPSRGSVSLHLSGARAGLAVPHSDATMDSELLAAAKLLEGHNDNFPLFLI